MASAAAARDAGRANGADAGSVVEACLGTLAELLQVAPVEKRAKIEALMERYVGPAQTMTNACARRLDYA